MQNQNSNRLQEDAALLEQVQTYSNLPRTIKNILQLADQFCHNNSSQRETQVCAVTLLKMLDNEQQRDIAFDKIQFDELETLQRNILMRFGDCQLSKQRGDS